MNWPRWMVKLALNNDGELDTHQGVTVALALVGIFWGTRESFGLGTVGEWAWGWLIAAGGGTAVAGTVVSKAKVAAKAKLSPEEYEGQ